MSSVGFCERQQVFSYSVGMHISRYFFFVVDTLYYKNGKSSLKWDPFVDFEFLFYFGVIGE